MFTVTPVCTRLYNTQCILCKRVFHLILVIKPIAVSVREEELRKSNSGAPMCVCVCVLNLHMYVIEMCCYRTDNPPTIFPFISYPFLSLPRLTPHSLPSPSSLPPLAIPHLPIDNLQPSMLMCGQDCWTHKPETLISTQAQSCGHFSLPLTSN